MAVAKEYVFPTDLTPFEQELHVLAWFRENFTTNPKKLKKMNIYICPLLPLFLQENLCLKLGATRDPVGFLKQAFQDLDAYPVIMQGLIDDGNHGMIMEGAKIYGVVVDTREKWLDPVKDGRWTEEDEDEIMDKVLLTWMAKERRQRFQGRLVLFTQFGFSGTPQAVDHKFSEQTWAELQEVYKKEDAERTRLELEYLLNPERREQQE